MQIFHFTETPLSPLRARRMLNTGVKCKFVRATTNPFVTSWLSDIQNCGKTMIFVCGELPRMSLTFFIHFCVRCCSETYISKFLNARRCSETQIFILVDEPSRGIRCVDRAKLWRKAKFKFQELLRALYWTVQCSENRIMNVAATLSPRCLRALYCVVLCSTEYYCVVNVYTL